MAAPARQIHKKNNSPQTPALRTKLLLQRVQAAVVASQREQPGMPHAGALFDAATFFF